MGRLETELKDTKGTQRCYSRGEIDWDKLLKQSRHEREAPNVGTSKDFFQSLRSYFPSMKSLLQDYNNALDDPTKLSKDEKKQLILDTRAALRLAQLCSSLEDADLRKDVVNAMIVEACHVPLFRLISSNRGDPKCRTLASQVLSNLVTSDSEAANCIASSVAFSASKESVSETIRQGIVEEENLVESRKYSTESPNWVDMLLACAHAENRQAVAGIVAALYNLTTSLQMECDSKNQLVSFAKDLASNSMVMSTLLRHIISLQSVKHAFDKRPENAINEKQQTTDLDNSLGDSATEWVSLLVAKFCKLGLLPNMMTSAGGGGVNQSPTSDLTIVPEHVVLLQCVHSEIETSLLDSPPEQRNINLLGGEVLADDVVSTHTFLSKLFCSLRASVQVESIATPETNDPDIVLQCSALVLLLEILASSLGVDNADLLLARREVGGNDCGIIQDASKELGALVDTLTARNSGLKSRDFYISDEEQRVITALVRFIGNVCHGCRRNQDLVRLTKIPLPIQLISSESDQPLEERNALHVLLSCTSVAHSCFTLREWAVVAIRNLLEQNELNQAEVAKLEANQPVQTATLADMGVRVDMDAKGRVSVIPEDKEL